MEKKLMLIINPAAGRGAYKLNIGDALQILDAGGYRTTLYYTAAPTEVELDMLPHSRSSSITPSSYSTSV